jgi:hypothetical protein
MSLARPLLREIGAGLSRPVEHPCIALLRRRRVRQARRHPVATFIVGAQLTSQKNCPYREAGHHEYKRHPGKKYLERDCRNVGQVLGSISDGMVAEPAHDGERSTPAARATLVRWLQHIRSANPATDMLNHDG